MHEHIPQEFDHRTGNDGTGYYIRTFTGKQLFWSHVEDHDYDIKDIAHALSMRVRWSGHVREFYSIAQHSVLVMQHMAQGASREVLLGALMHDANEAYLPDFPSPLKWFLAAQDVKLLKNLETRIDAAIAKKFNFPYPRDPRIKQSDLLLLAAEHTALMPAGGERDYMKFHGDKPMKLPHIYPWQWQTAEENFIRAFDNLCK
jgi:uncharacterized protein